MDFLQSLWSSVGITEMTIQGGIMILISCLLMYLAIAKKYEPLLLLPIAFGMLLADMPMPEALGIPGLSAYDEGGLLHFLYQGIPLGIFPPLIFLCIGAMTDFGPIIASPKNAIIGLGGQFGILIAFGLALLLGGVFDGLIPGFDGFTAQEAASIAIIGSSDGPTAIFITSNLAEHLLPTIAIAAYSYMALVPIIQPPIMRLLTTQKERVIVMPEPKNVTKRQKIIFPIAVTIGVLLLVPAAGGLISMLMLGNLIRESGVAERYVRTLSTELLNILTLVIGLSIGATATAERMLNFSTVLIICLGLLAFCFGTVGGVLVAKLMNFLSGGKINPLIGNAGVSAMPMAARVSQKMGQEYNPQNHLIMHAMGPIVASTLGSAIFAGIFLALLGG
jgi:oxaloacetate decarboxylase beta subunit